VNWYQKGQTNLDFTEARDSEWQWHQLSHMQVCTSLQTDNHASTPPRSFLQARCPSCRPTNSVKALKANKKAMVGLQKHKPYNLLHCTPIEALRSARARLLLLAGHHGCEGAHVSMSPRGLGQSPAGSRGRASGQWVRGADLRYGRSSQWRDDTNCGMTDTENRLGSNVLEPVKLSHTNTSIKQANSIYSFIKFYYTVYRIYYI